MICYVFSSLFLETYASIVASLNTRISLKEHPIEGRIPWKQPIIFWFFRSGNHTCRNVSHALNSFLLFSLFQSTLLRKTRIQYIRFFLFINIIQEKTICWLSVTMIFLCVFHIYCFTLFFDIIARKKTCMDDTSSHQHLQKRTYIH